jgi:branched-chain amino acid transport system substrate-binding protein
MIKKLSFVTVALVFLFFLTIAGGRSATAAEPIKIGFLAPYVGVFATFGQDLSNGFKLYLEEVGYKAGGRQIVLYDEDEEGKPEVGLVKVRKLIENDHVQIIAGIVSSPVAYAVRDYVVDKKVPIFYSAGAAKLTRDLRSPYIFRASFANGQQDVGAGWYAYTTMGARKIIVMGDDYAAGHEKCDGFLKGFKAMGGEVVEEIWAPLGTTDYAPYLAKLTKYVGKVDRLWNFFPGSDGVRFINQYQEYGFKDKIKLFGEGGTTEEANLPSQKDAAIGVESYLYYCNGVDTPENLKFIKAYQQRYKMDPGSQGEIGYVTAKVIVTGIEAVKGKIEDQQAFLKALKMVKFSAPRGPIRFDENNNVIENTYILRAEKRDGKYNNYVIATIPDVGQDWVIPKAK